MCVCVCVCVCVGECVVPRLLWVCVCLYIIICIQALLVLNIILYTVYMWTHTYILILKDRENSLSLSKANDVSTFLLHSQSQFYNAYLCVVYTLGNRLDRL